MPENDWRTVVEVLGNLKVSQGLTERMLDRFAKIQAWKETGRIKDEQALLAMDREKGRRYVDLFLPGEGAEMPEDDTTIIADNITTTRNTGLPWALAGLLAGAGLIGGILWWTNRPEVQDTDTNTMTVLEIFRPEDE